MFGDVISYGCVAVYHDAYPKRCRIITLQEMHAYIYIYGCTASLQCAGGMHGWRHCSVPVGYMYGVIAVYRWDIWMASCSTREQIVM